MALDAVMIALAAKEIEEHLTGARVDRIYMPARDTVILNVRNEKGTKRLLISARSGMSRVHFTEAEYDNPQNPPAFCMLLRKYLQSAKVRGLRTLDAERMLLLDFDAVSDMGDKVTLSVSIELMGRYSNIILINQENRIIDALKHIDSEKLDARRIFPGAEFQPPPAQNKLSVLSCETERLIEKIKTKSLPLSSAILESLAGIGPAVCREIAFLSSPNDSDADVLEKQAENRLFKGLNAVKLAAGNKQVTYSIVYEGDKPVEFSYIPLTQYRGLRTEYYGSVSELLDRYYSKREHAELMRARSADLKRQVNTIYERTLRRQTSREQELNSTEKADKAKLYGELLTAYLGQLTKGIKQTQVTDYYSGQTITIPLDPQKTPVQNAQKYYRDYRKLTTARKILGELLDEGKKEIEYLESVKYEVETAQTEQEFLAIRKELKDSGYLKAYKEPKSKQKKINDYYRYISSDGFSIVAGRNNGANDKLTLREASKNDLWFHAKNGAGSHTVILTEGKQVSGETMTEAAAIAAYHSVFRRGEQVAVDYTEIKNVKKAPGQKAGMVIYSNYKTAYVTPDSEKIESLIDNTVSIIR